MTIFEKLSVKCTVLKKTFGQLTFRSNELSISWPFGKTHFYSFFFGQMTFSVKRCSIERRFGQLAFQSNKIRSNSVRSNGFRSNCVRPNGDSVKLHSVKKICWWITPVTVVSINLPQINSKIGFFHARFGDLDQYLNLFYNRNMIFCQRSILPLFFTENVSIATKPVWQTNFGQIIFFIFKNLIWFPK
jgi:hypothetical protein